MKLSFKLLSALLIITLLPSILNGSRAPQPQKQTVVAAPSAAKSLSDSQDSQNRILQFLSFFKDQIQAYTPAQKTDFFNHMLAFHTQHCSDRTVVTAMSDLALSFANKFLAPGEELDDQSVMSASDQSKPKFIVRSLEERILKDLVIGAPYENIFQNDFKKLPLRQGISIINAVLRLITQTKEISNLAAAQTFIFSLIPPLSAAQSCLIRGNCWLEDPMIEAVKDLSSEAKTILFNNAIDSYNGSEIVESFKLSFLANARRVLQLTEIFVTMNSKMQGAKPRLVFVTLDPKQFDQENVSNVLSNPQVQSYQTDYQIQPSELEFIAIQVKRFKTSLFGSIF